MNKRIRELAEQAAEYAAQNAAGDWEVGPDYQDIFNQKFAELIVQQCIAIVDKYGDSDEGNHIAYQIEQHFGVKE
jgi:hypothetical protein